VTRIYKNVSLSKRLYSAESKYFKRADEIDVPAREDFKYIMMKGAHLTAQLFGNLENSPVDPPDRAIKRETASQCPKPLVSSFDIDGRVIRDFAIGTLFMCSRYGVWRCSWEHLPLFGQDEGGRSCILSG
jgi:hypothetical protein